MMSDSDILRELRKISKIPLLANSTSVERELEKVVSTEDKKRMWVLIDGKRMPKDIANDGKVSERAVNYFLTAASAAEVVDYTKGKPPRRTLDYIPPAWIELAKLPESENEVPAAPNQTAIDFHKEQPQ